MEKLNLSADQVLTTTRAVRKRLDFDRPVPDAVIRDCLELTLQAPTGSNRQGWRWVVVTDADTSDNPMAPILPSATMSAIAPTESSIGVTLSQRCR